MGALHILLLGAAHCYERLKYSEPSVLTSAYVHNLSDIPSVVTWTSFTNICVAEDEEDLPQLPGDDESHGSLAACQASCERDPLCHAIEWYGKRWAGLHCFTHTVNDAMVFATHGALTKQWKNATCYTIHRGTGDALEAGTTCTSSHCASSRSASDRTALGIYFNDSLLSQIPIRPYSKYYYLTQRYPTHTSNVKYMEALVRRVASIANVTRFFHSIWAMTRLPSFLRNDPRWERHLRFLRDPRDDSRRGAGFWFWKSAMINHVLKHMFVPQNHWLTYSDGDIFPSADGNYWAKYVESIHPDANMVAYKLPYSEHHWTKQDTFAALNFSSRRDGILQSGALVIKNTEATRAFLEEWVHLSSQYHLVSDEPSILSNNPEFREHRHDQSIFSLLIKKYACKRRQMNVDDCAIRYWKREDHGSAPERIEFKIE